MADKVADEEESMEEGEPDGAECTGVQVLTQQGTKVPAERVTSIFKGVFQRAYSSGVYHAQAVPTPSIPMGSLSTGEQQVKTDSLPVYPQVDYWFKTAESMPNLKPHERVVQMRSTILPVEVTGLNHREWNLPEVEKSLLPDDFKRERRSNYTPPPQPIHAVGDKYLWEAWLSCLRTANPLSCAGMIIDYVKQTSDPSDEKLHVAVLEAAGVDLDSLA